MLFGLCGFCFSFALWFLFVCFALVRCYRTVKAQWIMYRSLFSSSFGAHCRYDDVATSGLLNDLARAIQSRPLYGRRVSTSFLNPVFGAMMKQACRQTLKPLAAECLVGVRFGLLNFLTPVCVD